MKKFKASLALADDPTTGSNNQNGSPTTPTPSKKQQKQQKQQKQEQAKEKEQGKQQQQQQEEKVDETNKSPAQVSVPIRSPPPLPTPPVKREDGEVASSAELDKALHEWYSEQCDMSILNDDSLKAKAEEINLQLYPDEKTRKQITNAWVCSWKRKHAVAQPDTPVSPEIESRREAEEGAEGDKDRDEDEEMKSEGDSVSSTTSTPPPKAGESEEKRRRKEIKRLRKDIEKRDIQMAKAKIRKEASLRRLEELERENAAAR